MQLHHSGCSDDLETDIGQMDGWLDEPGRGLETKEPEFDEFGERWQRLDNHVVGRLGCVFPASLPNETPREGAHVDGVRKSPHSLGFVYYCFDIFHAPLCRNYRRER